MPHPNESLRRITDYLLAWTRAQGRGYRSGGPAGQYEVLQLHYRADPRGPESQLTFRARIADGRPVLQVDLPDSAEARSFKDPEPSDVSRQGVPVSGTGLPMREPEAICEACGTQGTVGRAARIDGNGNVIELHRFCLQCWPEHAARYRARWEEEDRRTADSLRHGAAPLAPASARGTAFEAATWHQTLHFVREIEGMLAPPVPPSPTFLAQMAAEIRRRAPEIEGDMPFEIAAFLQRYGMHAG